MKKGHSRFEEHRQLFHKQIFDSVLYVDSNGIPNNADKHSNISVSIAKEIVRLIGIEPKTTNITGQTSGSQFEIATKNFISNCLIDLSSLYSHEYSLSTQKEIYHYEQYEHLVQLNKALKINPQLKTILGDYIIKPDIVLSVKPLSDDSINKRKLVVSNLTAQHSPMRLNNNKHHEILHASISCKWTIRSDRSQNARTEGLNLIRNRKGHTPHIMIVTAEPYPNRIASIAMGTGDIDCVYHFSLFELEKAVNTLGDESAKDMVSLLVEGKRLRDISDLPLDLLDF